METYTMGLRRSDEKLSAAMRENEVVLIESDYKQHYAGFDPRVPESYIIFDMVNETNMAQSVELAQLIQRNVCSTASRPNKGVRQDAFLVLRETSMPACLIELGYITTASEARYLTNPTNVDAMGRGIYQAFVAYKNKYSQTSQTQQQTPQQQTPQTPQPQPENTPQTNNDTITSPPSQGGTEGETANGASVPIFKVQLLASSTQLSTNDRQLKGLTGVECYKEGGLWKYTIGSSADYNEISRLRRSVLNKFPQAFIIAFKNGERVDAAAALQEFRNSNK
jgi:N-acetylmuramoyl-L-alanine amidase